MAEASQTWIRTTDQKPPHREDVFVYLPGCFMEFQIGYWDEAVNDWWVGPGGYLKNQQDPPTHWMLPMAPQREGTVFAPHEDFP